MKWYLDHAEATIPLTIWAIGILVIIIVEFL